VRAEKGRAQIDVERRVPVGSRQRFEGMLHVDRRHVDEDVEAPQRGGRGVDQRGAGWRLREVGLQHRGAAAGRRDACRR